MFDEEAIRRKERSGLALTTIAIFIIAFFSLTTITLFINSPLRKAAEDLYCSVHARFGETPAFCGSDTCEGEVVDIETSDKKEIGMEIAALSYACLKGKAGCSRGSNLLCYTINLPDSSQTVTETDVTEALKGGDTCPVDLQNNRVVLPNGSLTNYAGCGHKDQLKWRVSNNVIKGQTLIIEYNYQNHTILIE